MMSKAKAALGDVAEAVVPAAAGLVAAGLAAGVKAAANSILEDSQGSGSARRSTGDGGSSGKKTASTSARGARASKGSSQKRAK